MSEYRCYYEIRYGKCGPPRDKSGVSRSLNKAEVPVGNTVLPLLRRTAQPVIALKKNPHKNIKICSLIIIPIHLCVDCILKIIFF